MKERKLCFEDAEVLWRFLSFFEEKRDFLGRNFRVRELDRVVR
jgi:hypothetical protein